VHEITTGNKDKAESQVLVNLGFLFIGKPKYQKDAETNKNRAQLRPGIKI
jgi:hypothetical protein